MIRSSGWVFLVLMLLPAFALAQESEDGDHFAGFRIPEHRVFYWTGDFSSSASRSDESGLFGEDERGSVSGLLRTLASWRHDSDPKLRDIKALLSASGGRFGRDSRGIFGTSELRDRSVEEQWILSLVERRYPWAIPIGFEASVTASGNYRQTWYRFHSVDPLSPFLRTQRTRERVLRHEYRLIGGAAIGGGRVRDATAVYDVLILEERLRRRGVLSGPLSSATRSQIAGLVYVRESHYSVLDRPGKTFWSELVEILEKDSSYQGNLTPSVVLETLEPYLGGTVPDRTDLLPRPLIVRLRGAFVGVTSEAVYAHFIDRRERSDFLEHVVNDTLLLPFASESSSRLDFEQVDIFLGPKVQLHRPIGTRWQVDISSALLFPTEDFRAGLRLNSTGSVRWIVADRWLAGFNVSHSRFDDDDSPQDDWFVSGAASLDWYIENRVRLGLRATTQQQDETDSFQRFHGLSLSLGYRFAGRLEAPGLIEPIRSR